jgi:DNA-binding response OmpR family regulator
MVNTSLRRSNSERGANRARLDGWEVARRAREISPAFPIVYMSGASAGDWTSKGVPHSIMLAKPFAPAQLVTAVAQLLNVATAPEK